MRFMVLVTALLIATGAQAEDEPAVITVTGLGRVSAMPDMAIVQIGVQERARDASLALRAVSGVLEDVFDDVEKAGIEAKDVQTSAVNISPQYNRNSGAEPTLVGYVAASQIRLRVRDLDVLGEILDTVVSSGANRLNGLSLVVADPSPLRDEARRLAVADARAKAELYAQAAGVELGAIVSLSEAVASNPIQVQRFAMAEAVAVDVPIAAGEVDTTQSITIVYEIKQ